MPKTRLIVSEQFYSLQGEGPSVGRPAVFLRLAGCNLQCMGFSYKDPADGTHLGCDTKLVWQKGAPHTAEAILNHWQQNDWCAQLAAGAHLVITGGEPLIQQNKIMLFLKQLDVKQNPDFTYIEVETNGTVLPNDYLSTRINQFNVSPKLTSSLESRTKAYHSNVLQHFAQLPQAIFKFVIQDEADVLEVIQQYQNVFQIARQRIWLMPEGGTRIQMAKHVKLVAEACKQHGFNFSPRLHITIWDEATGV